MSYIFQVLLVATVFGVSFLRGIIPDLIYFVLIICIPVFFALFWKTKYYFNQNQLESFTREKYDFSIFAGKINSVDKDITRGLFVINKNQIQFWKKQNQKFKKIWDIEKKDLKDIGISTVSTNRLGFTVIHKDGNTEFTCRTINKKSTELLNLLELK